MFIVPAVINDNFQVNEVVDHLMKRLHSRRNSDNIVENLRNELNRWNVECKLINIHIMYTVKSMLC